MYILKAEAFELSTRTCMFSKPMWENSKVTGNSIFSSKEKWPSLLLIVPIDGFWMLIILTFDKI